MASYEEQIAKSRERFERDTAEHEMTVLRDDGPYRHLRCQKPGTYIYGFDIVTWPGYLAIVGDCGDYVFSRVRDMFEFFETDHGINPDYWSQKLQAPRHDAARVYLPDAFEARVGEWYESITEDWPADEKVSLRRALNEQVLDDWLGWRDSEHEAHCLLRDFEGRYIDASEWDLREYDGRFLWCCWAIVWGIGKYRAATTDSAPLTSKDETAPPSSSLTAGNEAA